LKSIAFAISNIPNCALLSILSKCILWQFFFRGWCAYLSHNDSKQQKPPTAINIYKIRNLVSEWYHKVQGSSQPHFLLHVQCEWSDETKYPHFSITAVIKRFSHRILFQYNNRATTIMTDKGSHMSNNTCTITALRHSAYPRSPLLIYIQKLVIMQKYRRA
jgi:hypothetical protein